MATNTTNPINQIFNDLDKYRDFCRDYGYKFNEADLYSSKSFVYRQFQRFITGKPVKNQWEVDLVKFREQGILKGRA